MDDSSTSGSKLNIAPSAVADGLSVASGEVAPSSAPSLAPSLAPSSTDLHAESSWDRLSLALNRLESAMLAKQNNLTNSSVGNGERDAKLERSLQKTMQANRERDVLKKAIESTLGDIRSLLK